jgi:hypothetical protein
VTRVGHVDPQLVVPVAERDRGRGRPGVPDGVGQRLLDDAVGGQVHGGRQRDGLPGHGERGVQAGPAGPGDQGLELGGARRRLGGVGVVGLTQHVQDGAELPEPLLARGLDRLQRIGYRLGAGGQDVGGHPGLHVDGGHGVRDDVVQLAGDAQPLLVDAAAGILLGPVLDGLHVGAPVRHGDTGEQRRGDHERDDVEPTPADVPEGVVRRGDRQQHREGRHGRCHRTADGDLCRHRVQGQDGGDQGGTVDVAEQRVRGHRRDGDCQHGNRVAAPPGQNQAGDRDQQHPGSRMRRRVATELNPVGRVPGITLAETAGHQQEGHHRGEHGIPDGRAEPSPPRRRHTFHARKTKHGWRFRRPPPVDRALTPRGVRRPRLIPWRYGQVTATAGRPAGVRGGTLDLQLAERPPAR